MRIRHNFPEFELNRKDSIFLNLNLREKMLCVQVRAFRLVVMTKVQKKILELVKIWGIILIVMNMKL